MHFEIPKFTRCCGCLPLRRGIIVLGYLSLGITLFFITIELWFEGIAANTYTYVMYRGTMFLAHRWLPILLYSIEIVFIVMLLVGAHTRRRQLMRIYYYYGITTCAASFATYLLVSLPATQSHWSFYIIDVCTVFSGLVTQLYLLLLIRSELEKPMDSIRRVNDLAEIFAQPARNGLDHV